MVAVGLAEGAREAAVRVVAATEAGRWVEGAMDMAISVAAVTVAVG